MNPGDIGFMMAASALVLLMTPGLAFFYGGLVRRKSVVGVIMHSFMAMGIVGVVWVLWGYTLAFGADKGGFIGNFDFLFLKDVAFDASLDAEAAIPDALFMMFQGMFAIITPALITGAFVERMKFHTYIIFIIMWVTIVYAPMAHWVWADGGWLKAWGVLDFAGGSVVHMNSGLAALAAAWIIGRRLRHGEEPMDSHNVPFVILGAALLWFGWFGFNAGSELAANGVAVMAFVVTNTAAAMGAVTWMALSWYFSGKASAIGAASGAVAGLVAITPASGYVGAMPALVIGLGAGAFCFAAVHVIRRIRVDDALDVFAVHGIGGTWGALATGLFAGIGTLGLYEIADGRAELIGKQAVAILVTWGWSFVVTSGILLLLKYTIGLRVDEATEEQGLDIAIHGDEAYPELSY